jgi:hypothetical protein
MYKIQVINDLPDFERSSMQDLFQQVVDFPLDTWGVIKNVKTDIEVRRIRTALSTGKNVRSKIFDEKITKTGINVQVKIYRNSGNSIDIYIKKTQKQTDVTAR